MLDDVEICIRAAMQQQPRQRRRLTTSYNHCRRRKSKTKYNDVAGRSNCDLIVSDKITSPLSGVAVNKFLLLATMFLMTMTAPTTRCLTEAAAAAATATVTGAGTGATAAAVAVAAASPSSASNGGGLRVSPLTALLKAAADSSSASSTTQRQLQQQQLFALLSLNRMPQPTLDTPASPVATTAKKTATIKGARDSSKWRKAASERGGGGDRNGGDELTAGYVADDGQRYEKAGKALAAAAIAGTGSGTALQQTAGSSIATNHNNNNNNDHCPKECKCLNDYFDCGKKHLDRVPPLPTYVQIIDFVGNKLNDTSALQIRNLPELHKLVLKRNQLENVPKFVGLSALKQLNLAHNRIQRISSEALAALPKLKSLDLSKNYLHSIEASYFPANNRLAHLILNANEIANVDENAFESLNELLDLELSNNRLTTLPGGVFKNLNKLKKLSLNYNSLEIHWSTFRGLQSLQKLFLKSNNIRGLQDGVFHVMRGIETIELDHNGITSLSRQGLFNLTRLHHLGLSNNSISRIELDTWEFTQSLITLDLSHNNITEFKPQHLDCLQRLRHLNLGHNKIQYLVDNTFDCVKNLEELNLRRNKLAWIIEDPGAAPPFKALRKLKKLDLYGNNLKQINTKSLSGLASLESLNLGGNALASIQTGAFEHMSHLQKLSFKSLNFICDCELLWFRRWLHRHYQAGGANAQSHPSSATQAVCGYPEHLLDRELLTLSQADLVCADTPKPVITQEPSNQLAVKGANITMECIASSPAAASLAATDELKIKWRHDNQNIRERDRSLLASGLASPFGSFSTTETQIHHDQSKNQTTIIGYLRLFNVSYESAGRYQCVVSNAFGTTYSQKFKISIGIHPSFLQIPSNLTIDSGDTARLVCSATGDPMPEIALQKFGASDFPAATERRLQVIREENAFVITNAKPIDTGIYTCTAESAAGEIKVNASLVVNDKPLPDIPLVRKEIVVGKSSVLECLNEMAAELDQPHREWYKDNKPFYISPTSNTERYYFTSEKELLIIVNTQSIDAGRYRCEITDNSKTYTMQMELIVVKEDFSQHVIIVGVVLVTVVCIVVGSLIIWAMLCYQKRKVLLSSASRGMTVGAGARVGAANSSALDQTQLTTLNRTFLRQQRESPSSLYQQQRPRSLAALELNGVRLHGVTGRGGDYDARTDDDQRSRLIVTKGGNYQHLLLQRNADERGLLEEHLTLDYLRRNSAAEDVDHQQDHLSSKDSGTGSDAAVKRSIEDFSLTLLPSASTPTTTTTTVAGKRLGRASLARADTDDDEDYVNGKDVALGVPPPRVANVTEGEFETQTLGMSEYDVELSVLNQNNNHTRASLQPSNRRLSYADEGGGGGGGGGGDDGGGGVSSEAGDKTHSPATLSTAGNNNSNLLCKTTSTNFHAHPSPPFMATHQAIDI